MNQMIEKLASVVSKTGLGGCEGDGFVAPCDQKYCNCRAAAIAVLTAIREPSEEMVEAGATAQAYPWPDPTAGEAENAKDTFTAMIDSILPKGGEHG